MSNFPPLAPPKACDSQEGIKCTKAKEQLRSYDLYTVGLSEHNMFTIGHGITEQRGKVAP